MESEKRSLYVGQASLFEGGGPKGRREAWQCDRFPNGFPEAENGTIGVGQASLFEGGGPKGRKGGVEVRQIF